MNTYNLGALGIVIAGSSFKDFGETLLSIGHRSRTDGGDATGKLVFGYGVQCFFGAIAKIVSHTPMKMNICQAGNYIQMLCVNDSPIIRCV